MSRHKQHKRRVVDDAPYEPAAVQAIEDAPGEQQENPAAGQQYDPVSLEEVNGDELPSTPSPSNRRVAIAISPRQVPESTSLQQVSFQALINY